MSDWLRVCSLDRLAEGQIAAVRCGELDLALVRSGEAVYAFENVCSHSAYSFTGLALEDGCVLECAAHGARFDVRDGRVLKGPAGEGLLTYQARVEGNDVLLRRDGNGNR